MSTGVEFEEPIAQPAPAVPASVVPASKTGKVASFLVRAGIAKTEKESSVIILVVLVVALVLSIVIAKNTISKEAKPVYYEDLDPLLRQSLDPSIRETLPRKF